MYTGRIWEKHYGYGYPGFPLFTLDQIHSQFPNFSRPGKPKMKFPMFFFQIPNAIATLII